eukprot:1555010-Amphidinium_carterae.1
MVFIRTSHEIVCIEARLRVIKQLFGIRRLARIAPYEPLAERGVINFQTIEPMGLRPQLLNCGRAF